jgi:hypothetical protein
MDLDDFIPGSTFFRWREALWLPTWKIYVYPSPEIQKNIIYTAKNVADVIRGRFGKPMQILSWYRPELYNEWGMVNGTKYGISGAPGSQHVLGKAIDFKIYTISNDEVRAYLEPNLERLKIRMERPDGQDRIHVDWANVMPGGSRYFNAR